MTFREFQLTIEQDEPPSDIGPLLLALWYDARGDWETSHTIAQEITGTDGAKVHAYLHRKEGDLWNADYWYRQAGAKRPSLSLDEEWEVLVRRFTG